MHCPLGSIEACVCNLCCRSLCHLCEKDTVIIVDDFIVLVGCGCIVHQCMCHIQAVLIACGDRSWHTVSLMNPCHYGCLLNTILVLCFISFMKLFLLSAACPPSWRGQDTLQDCSSRRKLRLCRLSRLPARRGQDFKPESLL